MRPLPRSLVALPLLALAAVLALTPSAAAQSPQDVVALVCDVADDTPAPGLPVCPAGTPGAPAPAGREQPQEPPAHQHQDPVGGAQDVAQQAQDTVQDLVDDPTNPGPALDLVTLIVQFILDTVLGPLAVGFQAAGTGLAKLVMFPIDAVAAAGEGIADGAVASYDALASGVAAAADAASATGESIASAVESAREFVAGLFTSEAAAAGPADVADLPGHGGKGRTGLVDLPDVRVPEVSVKG